jgi:hypothetical protein
MVPYVTTALTWAVIAAGLAIIALAAGIVRRIMRPGVPWPAGMITAGSVRADLPAPTPEEPARPLGVPGPAPLAIGPAPVRGHDQGAL